MKFAYADPPYIGQAKKHYDCPEVDHSALIKQLMDEYPDGWALSLSSPTLKQILNMCPDNGRVGAWVKPFAVFKINVNPKYCWEPVIFYGGRKYERYDAKVRDFVSANITMQKGCPGAKPKEFAFWIFELLNMKPEDDFVDLYPGSGNMIRAWFEFKNLCPTPLFKEIVE